MEELQYDFLVIGGGPGGYTAAIRATQLGMSSAVIERDRLGGVCLNWGCIPTKALLKNAELLHSFRKAGEWGISYENLKVDFPKIIKRSRGVAERISKGVEYLMKKNSIRVIPGEAKLSGRGAVQIRSADGSTSLVRAKHIVLATGARPRPLPGTPFDRVKIITSSEAMNLPEQPESMVIVGAGAIGVEFAYFYNALGTKVTLVEMLPGILPVEDRELTKLLELSLKKQGIDILTGTSVTGIAATKEGVTVRVKEKEEERSIAGDVALVAIGVQGNTEGIGLEVSGVALEKGFVKVDERYRTNVEGIYAIGDVAGPPWLAHVAAAEGIACAEVAAGKEREPIDYDTIPGCTYCQPQIASVGLTEEKAHAAGHELKIGKFPFRPLGKAMAIGETEGMVKLIFDAKYGELLGAHILGSEATEMIAELTVAKSLETTGEKLFRTIHAHPTLSEAVMEAAAAAYGEAINI
jgi:dihydrolipoamide dehydrogenase